MPRATRTILLIGIGALAWRVVYVIVWGHDPLVFGDGLYYHLQGQGLADGRGFAQPIAYAYFQGVHPSAQHPPLYALLLAAVTRTGRALGAGSFDTTIVHQVASAFISSLGVVVTGFAARRLAGARAGVAAALVAAIYPAMWVNDALVMSESLVVPTTALVLLAVFMYHDEPTVRHAVALGAAAGAAVLTRSEAVTLVVAVVVPLVLVARGESRRVRVERLATVLAVCGLLVAPWVIRNLTTFHRTVLLSENVDSVIGGANCEPTYNGPHIGSWDFDCNTFSLPKGDESDEGAEVRHRGLQYAVHHLARVPIVAAARVGRVLEVFRPFDDENDAGRFRWTEVANFVMFFPMQLIAFIGLRRLRRAGRIVWPFVVMFAAMLAVVMVTYGLTRFRVPWDVATVVLAGVVFGGIGHPDRAAPTESAASAAWEIGEEQLAGS